MRNPATSTSTSNADTGAGLAKTTPCCTKVGLKRGPWTPEEDELLANYINNEGEGRWRTLPKRAGLLRCGKSCRLRWMNYLRPSVKRGHIAPDEEDLILRLHRLLGNRWSLIAGRIPGRTDNEIKNYWNTHLSKKLISQGIDPRTHRPLTDVQISSNNNNFHKQKEVSLSSSKPSATPNPNQMLPSYNSDESNSGVLVGNPDGRGEGGDATLFHNKPNSITTEEFCFDPTRNSISIYNHPNPNANANGLVIPCNNGVTVNTAAHNDPLNFEASFRVTTNNKNNESPGTGSFEGQEEDPNYCNDEVFSSFLNSLINEDMFTSQSQQQLPRYDALLTQPTPSSFVFGSPAGWDASPLMTNAITPAGIQQNISPDDQPQ